MLLRPTSVTFLEEGEEIVWPEVPKRYNQNWALIVARQIAKFGLGYAVMLLGPNGFTPLIRDFILGKDTDFFQWMGGHAKSSFTGGPQPKLEPTPEHMHLTDLTFYPGAPDNREYVLVHLRLFSNFNGPHNWVVVGTRPTQPTPL